MTPITVLISDVHYSVHTIKLANAAMKIAIDKANELKVPLIVAGDLHDTKSNLRGECIKAMIETIKSCHICPFVIVGNHDRWNEKSPEHSLEFLRPYSNIIDKPMKNVIPYITLIPYNHDIEDLRNYLKTLNNKSTLIMHQGITNSNAGHYIQDKSALTPNDVAGFRIVSGHYHTRQTIELPNNGQWDYIGNPYTTNFGESSDPEKGFQILMDNGSLQFVTTNLRKHLVINLEWHKDIDNFLPVYPHEYSKEDLLDNTNLVWIKYHGPKEKLYSVTRTKVAASFGLKYFKLDLIPNDKTQIFDRKDLTQQPLLESLVTSLDTSEERKTRLKEKLSKLCE